MGLTLASLDQQVMVITGASSGIGLVTARMAARRGARVVLVARHGPALERLSEELPGSLRVVADVGREADVATIVHLATARLGGFDTWVNNAGVSIFGKI